MNPVLQAAITIGIAAFLLFVFLGMYFPTPQESKPEARRKQ
jgi:hypothetical protein